MPVEPMEDPTIKIKPGDDLIDYICKNVKNSEDVPDEIKAIKAKKKSEKKNTHLRIRHIKWLNEHLKEYRKQSGDKIYVHELLKTSDIILPTPKVTPRNPELEKRIQRLKAEQEAREYAAMTKNVDVNRKHLPEDTIAYQMKQINKQLIAVAQFIFSVLAGFAFGFIGVELIIGNLDFGFRLLLGIICALVVALAEIYFLAIKLSEDYIEPSPLITPKPQKLHQE
ncbi:transmembrane protein 199 [Prorops nasuta]|uniref:transmembrane protein 199 n=1 Tax=Prorops nasuta TaxID=863751 RepID=UPI0034CECBF6